MLNYFNNYGFTVIAFWAIISVLMLVKYSILAIKEHKKNQGFVAIGMIIGCIVGCIAFPYLDATGSIRTVTAISGTVLLAELPLAITIAGCILLRRNRI